MIHKIILFAISILLVQLSFAQQQYDFVVAKDGTGNFTTVQDAFDAVPHLRKKRTSIYIKNGTYKEKLILPSTKDNVVLIGESVEHTILTYDDYASKANSFGENVGTSGSSSFYLYGNDFYAENITFENSSGKVGQAVAMRVDGDRIIFNNCRFLGNQDTLYPHGQDSQQYYKNCYIEGTVDFIFGWSTAVFDSCHIHCKDSGFITAASTNEDTPFGFVFNNCTITGESDEATHYLGRPWRSYSSTIFMNCNLGAHIKPEGWDNWNKPNAEKTARYCEYNNTGAGADTTHRVLWANHLTDEEAQNYSLSNVFNDWNPSVVIKEIKE